MSEDTIIEPVKVKDAAEKEDAPRPSFKAQGVDSEGKDGDSAKAPSPADPVIEAGDKKPEQPAEAEVDEAQRPRFKPQGKEDFEEESKKKPREVGSTQSIKRSSVGERYPDEAIVVTQDFLALLSDSNDVAAFNGKMMTVTLGKGSKYLFDRDRLPWVMKAGASFEGRDTPDDIVIGRKGDPNFDPKIAAKAQQQKDARNVMVTNAAATQAAAVLASRAKGSTEPVPPTAEIQAIYQGNSALIVAERMEALNDKDLRAFAEKRLADVSVAASMMMSHGRESLDSDALAKEINMAPDFKEGEQVGPEAVAEEQQAPAAAGATVETEQASSGGLDAADGNASVGGAEQIAETVASETTATGVEGSTGADVSDQQAAAPANEVVGDASVAKVEKEAEPTQVSGSEKPTEVVAEQMPQAEMLVSEKPIEPAPQDGPKTLADQARLAAADLGKPVQAKGPASGAIDPAAIAALSEKWNGRG